MNMYNRNPHCYNAIQQNPYGDVAITGETKKEPLAKRLATPHNAKVMGGYLIASAVIYKYMEKDARRKGKQFDRLKMLLISTNILRPKR